MIVCWFGAKKSTLSYNLKNFVSFSIQRLKWITIEISSLEIFHQRCKMTLRNATLYKVVISDEEQYSIIPVPNSVSKGWRELGKKGSAKECLDYIEEVWTDMKPSDTERIMRNLGS
jgi:MbtH protein